MRISSPLTGAGLGELQVKAAAVEAVLEEGDGLVVLPVGLDDMRSMAAPGDPPDVTLLSPDDHALVAALAVALPGLGEITLGLGGGHLAAEVRHHGGHAVDEGVQAQAGGG